MQSIPVCGVDVRKAITEPFEAPWRSNDIPVGITPHEQSGIGTPKKDPKIVDFNDFEPRCFVMRAGENTVRSNPEMAKPASR